MIDLEKFEIFKDNMCTLKETSYDSANNEYMTESLKKVVNFDKVKEHYVKNYKLPKNNFIKSVDAFVQFDCLTFVEFKNGKLEFKDGREIYDKLIGSLLILSDITHKTISYTRNNIEFILVYNSEKNSSYSYIDSHTNSNAKLEFYKVQKTYFKSVNCIDKETFKEILEENGYV